jgi:hypothetical protein
MSYKRFDQEDIVVSSDSVTAPAWSNNVVELSDFYLKSTQINGSSGPYYHNVYDTAATESIQFSVAHGNRLGSGSAAYDAAVPSKSYSSTVYGQFRTMLLGDEDTDFTFVSSSTTLTPDNVLFISVERARYKEKVLPGSLFLSLSGSGGEVKLADYSLTASTDTFVDGGRVYSIYSGSNSGLVTSTAIEYGKLYPDVGVIALNGDILSSSDYVEFDGTSSNYTTDKAHFHFYNSIDTGSSFKLRSEETVSSNYVFIRARNSEFNYSNNPSNITGSGELRHSVMIDSPQAYVTAVGLYNDNNDLLAVAKLSTPLLKDFTKEALVRVKLDY